MTSHLSFSMTNEGMPRTANACPSFERISSLPWTKYQAFRCIPKLTEHHIKQRHFQIPVLHYISRTRDGWMHMETSAFIVTETQLITSNGIAGQDISLWYFSKDSCELSHETNTSSTSAFSPALLLYATYASFNLGVKARQGPHLRASTRFVCACVCVRVWCDCSVLVSMCVMSNARESLCVSVCLRYVCTGLIAV